MTIVELSYSGITTILNEYPLYDIVHVHEKSKLKMEKSENHQSKKRRSKRANKIYLIW